MKTAAQMADLLKRMAHNLNEAARVLDTDDGASETPAELAEDVMNKLQDAFDSGDL